MPDGVPRGTPLVYSKLSPGLRIGCSPTTPSPWTSRVWPLASVIFQWRVRNCTDSLPVFSMLTV